MTNIILKNQAMEKPTKKALAKRLGISRSMLYYQHKRPALDEEMKRQIESVMGKHSDYGHKRIAIELKLNKKTDTADNEKVWYQTIQKTSPETLKKRRRGQSGS